MKRILFLALFAGTLAANSGCGLYQTVFYGSPCGGYAGSVNECDEGCGPVGCSTSRPARRAVVADCGDGCGGGCERRCSKVGCRTCAPCDEGGCDPCADPCGNGCYARPWYRGPLSCVFALFTPPTWCGPNCGERYWGDFYSDPPACSDPCDRCGNYAGHGGGCRSCGGRAAPRGGYVDEGTPMGDDGELTPRAERVTTPTQQPTPATRRPPKPDSQ